MEGLITGATLGAGFLLSDNKINLKTTNNNQFIQPNESIIYNSNLKKHVDNKVEKIAERNFFNAKDSIKNNIIHRNHNTMYNDKNTHNNMTPFFGSKVTQNMNMDNSVSQYHNGRENFNNKREHNPLFEHTKDTNIIYGVNNNNDLIKNNTNKSMYKRNELPFEQIKVGVGLNKGYGSRPDGGFHQDTRAYVLPKSIDELRPASNPKLTYKGRVVKGKSINGKSAKMGKLEKNRPDTFYIQGADRYLTTTGANLKETYRSEIIMPDTNRKISKELFTGPGPAVYKKEVVRSEYNKDKKNIFKKSKYRNAYNKDSWKNLEDGDYGKKSIRKIENERETTGTRTHISNFTSIVKALISPLLDIMKPTKAEEYEENNRVLGNFGNSATSKHIVWDPNDIARTTIKETNIDNDHTGHMNSQQRGVAYDPNDIARTTIKETNIHDTRTGYMRINNKGTVIDKKSMKFKTTIRETIKPINTNLNMKVNNKNIVKDPNDVARTTIKETNIDNNRVGNLKGPLKLTTYDPDDVARTTMSETLIQDDRYGNVKSSNKDGGYLTNNKVAKNTNRQFTSDNDYTGIAVDTSTGLGYITNKKIAKNTNKQFTSDNEYSGGMNSMYKKPTTYDTTYNARLNEVKEGTLVGRYPTPESVKLYNGKDTVNINVRKIEQDYINNRTPIKSKVYNLNKSKQNSSLTKDRKQYNFNILDERIDPLLLNAFNNNPYTKSLKSF